MNQLFEYTDKLNTPYECFICSNLLHSVPIKPHFHYFVEILYMRQGSVLVNCDEKSYVLSEGDLILFPPSALHSIYALSDAAFRYDVLKFDPALLSIGSHNRNGIVVSLTALLADIKKNASDRIYIPSETLSPFSLSSLFDVCITEMNQKQYGYQSLLHARTEELMTYLLRYWHSIGLNTDILYAPPKTEESIYNITQYIDQHSGEDIKVSELARLCGMSYSYFAKNFRAIYGQSCKKYIESIRLLKAEDMLLFTSFDLNYISQETGFSDCSHLIHAFKEKYGTTPHQYRLRQSSTYSTTTPSAPTVASGEILSRY